MGHRQIVSWFSVRGMAMHRIDVNTSLQNVSRATLHRAGRYLRLLSLVLFPFLMLSLAASAASAAVGPYGVDLDGRPVPSLTDKQTQAVVLLFVASDCPISNRYVPQIRRLEHEFGPQHVAFWVIYPNPGDTASVVLQHEKDYGSIGNEIRDPNHMLVQLSHARVTPEAAVLVPSQTGFREVYLGRIDNRYIDFGQQRPQATRHDLQDAIAAVVHGNTGPRPEERPVGCYIVNLP